MTPEAVFSAASTTAMLSWLLLIVRPRASWVHLITGRVVPIAFAVLYAVILVPRFGGSDGGFDSLAAVQRLFADPWLLLAGWIHYLAFDLLTGVWETRDAAKRGIPHWMVIPCLLLTFMLGPAGWLLYQGVRTLRGSAEPTAHL
jgi:hypothetical protein